MRRNNLAKNNGSIIHPESNNFQSVVVSSSCMKCLGLIQGELWGLINDIQIFVNYLRLTPPLFQNPGPGITFGCCVFILTASPAFFVLFCS